MKDYEINGFKTIERIDRRVDIMTDRVLNFRDLLDVIRLYVDEKETDWSNIDIDPDFVDIDKAISLSVLIDDIKAYVLYRSNSHRERLKTID